MSHIKSFYEDLDPEIMEKVKKELGETEEIKTRGLAELKKLVKGEPDFYPCTDDIFLLRFLRFRKYEIDRAFTALKNYYKFKASSIDNTPSNIEHILSLGVTTFLEYRDLDGEGIGLHRSGVAEPNIDLDELIACGMLASEIGLTKELTHFTGCSFIFDLKGITIRHTLRYGGYSSLSKMWSGIVFHVHGSNMESLHKFISPDILPEELGGKQGPAAEWAEKYKKLALSMEDHFIRMRKYGYKNKSSDNK